jgi:hypothetical protein
MALRQPREREDSLSVKLGSLFEAHATGRGVMAVPIVVLVVVAAAVAIRLLLIR